MKLLTLLVVAAARNHFGVESTARLFTQDEVDAPVRRRRIVTQRVQGARGAVRRVRGPGRALRADALLEDDRQEGVLPRGEDGVGPPPEGVDNWV